jgi:glycosyltransferase involved in cell wall biosynthesis
MSVYYMNGSVERGSRSGRQLKIAQLAPLYESVPPKLYGGTERVVSYLTEALLARGHQVTLYASGDSTCRPPLHAGWPSALRLDGLGRLGPSYQLRMLSDVYERAADLDIIHSSRLLDLPIFAFGIDPHDIDNARSVGPARALSRLSILSRRASCFDH